MIASKRRISVIRQLAESFRGFADALKAGLNFIHGNKLYAVLEISAWCSDAELKRAYYRLVREYHPDALAAGGYAGALVVHAEQRLAVINAAYDTLARRRGMK